LLGFVLLSSELQLDESAVPTSNSNDEVLQH